MNATAIYLIDEDVKRCELHDKDIILFIPLLSLVHMRKRLKVILSNYKVNVCELGFLEDQYMETDDQHKSGRGQT